MENPSIVVNFSSSPKAKNTTLVLLYLNNLFVKRALWNFGGHLVLDGDNMPPPPRLRQACYGYIRILRCLKYAENVISIFLQLN